MTDRAGADLPKNASAVLSLDCRSQGRTEAGADAYQFWAKQAVSHFHPPGIYQFALAPVHYFHNFNEPTAFHVPILWDNR